VANEIIPSSIADLLQSETVAAEVLYLLAERDMSILNHPALFQATHNGPSDVVRVPHLGLGGYDLLSAHTPGSEVANTALTDGKTDVTVAPVAKRYNLDDFAKYLSMGKLGPMAFAQDVVISYAQTLISKLANVGDDFTNTVGSTGVDITWDNILEGKGKLAVAKATGPLLCVLHPQQWNDLERAAMALGVLPTESMEGTIIQGLQSYKGRYLGVDFFTSAHVPTANAGADRAGFMCARGGLAWADLSLDNDGDSNIVSFGRARLERARQGTYLSTSYVQSGVMGVAKAIDAAGVSIVTDA
jgi:hypothetical protein